MAEALDWYANLHKFYRILLLAAMGVGALLVGAGMTVDSIVIFATGLGWLAGGPAVVHLAARFEE